MNLAEEVAALEAGQGAVHEAELMELAMDRMEMVMVEELGAVRAGHRVKVVAMMVVVAGMGRDSSAKVEKRVMASQVVAQVIWGQQGMVDWED
mmetsp:Transcript_16295/g.27147  ORF Transcript_16295/g.27147 Transcript_16295/m.27147 type:complete len:93 (-) Transcript_16295:452-730(-)